jgi:iron complex outermembrane recepter protein
MNLNYFIRLGCWGIFPAAYFMLTTVVLAQGIVEGKLDEEKQIREKHLNHRSTARDLLAQAPVTSVTGLGINQTDKGLEVILKTPPGQPKLVPLILPEGNSLLVEILDATLAFSIRNGVTKTNPAPGISQVKVAKIDATSVRVTITGATQQPPTAAIVSGGQNLVLNVTPKSRAQVQADEEIEIVVTGEREEDNYAVPNSNVGTRTDAAIKDVPQAIQVVPQQVIKDQAANDITDVLRNTAGVTPSPNFGGLTVRGFSGTVSRDGLTQAEPFGFDRTSPRTSICSVWCRCTWWLTQSDRKTTLSGAIL